MAFKRHARALTSKRNIQFEQWMDELRKQAVDSVPEKQIMRTAKQVLNRCDPKQYLLSHATIVASVDTYSPKGVKLGRGFDEKGGEIDVRFPDFRIKPECQHLINNNMDAWSRPLLMTTYKTFVGCDNFLEHIQIKPLSKGFIVDAIARDVGVSCYIDILVATDRKHTKLVDDILSGKMTGLSMGCVSAFTICTHCGNVASDDSQLCTHIQYDGKGSSFVDRDGQEHKLSELIGHAAVPNSNQFIEASWVHNPAFRGAVRRNFLNAEMIASSPEFASQLASASDVYELKSGSMDFTIASRAASTIRWAEDEALESDPAEEPGADDLGSDDSDDLDFDTSSGDSDLDAATSSSSSGDSDSADEPEEKAPKDTLREMADKIKQQVLESIIKDLGKELEPTPEDVGAALPPSADMNDSLMAFDRGLHKTFAAHKSLINWASKVHRSLKTNRTATLKKLTARDLVVFSWIQDTINKKNQANELYQVAMSVGSINKYPSKKSFIAACDLRLNRTSNSSEREFLISKGRIASLSKKA